MTKRDRISLGLSFSCLVMAGLICAAAGPTTHEAPAGMPSVAAIVAPPMPAIKSLKLLPETLTLDDGRDNQRILVIGVTDSKDIDLSAVATLQSASDVVETRGDGYIRPRKAGAGDVVVKAGGREAKLHVNVKNAGVPKVGFVRDVEPIFASVGCNAGTCHGAATGKEGFKLSLRGYDPDYDYQALVDDLGGRRFDRVQPQNSLMLLKPAGAVPHEGGQVFKTDSEQYAIMRQWIEEGTQPEDLSARAQSVEVLPAEIYLDLPGRSQQVVVRAHYRDGSVRDVTRDAVITSNNTETATINGNTLTAIRRGEGALLIRYEGNYAARQFVVMGDRTGYAWANQPEEQYIDKLVDDKLKTMKIIPSEICADGDFIRRVYLDLTGQPPEGERVRAFLTDASDSATKRAKLVDDLLGSEAFIDAWSNKWADMLQCNSKVLGEKAMLTFRGWIRDQVSKNVPYDQFVRDVLLAKGSSFGNPQVNYLRATLGEPGKTQEDVTQTFLGVRFNCNKCHDHPFERWTQNQYYQFGAFFARTATKKGRLPEETIVYQNYNGGEINHPKTEMPVAPKVPFGDSADAKNAPDRREALVAWLTSAQNPLFAKSMANRVWSYFFGIGIIDPVDDIRASNPASNPELLDAITKDFVDHKFDVRGLMRTICLSRTYQRSVASNKWNEDDKINFSHNRPRRLSAEQLMDAVALSTGFRSQFKGLPQGTRAVEVPDGEGEVADTLGLFGKPKRQSACECERSFGFTLSHAVNLVNGDTIGNAVSAPNNKIAAIVAREKDNKKVIENLYLEILCRMPSDAEVASFDLGEGAARLPAAQDLAWALLNSPAFLYNR